LDKPIDTKVTMLRPPEKFEVGWAPDVLVLKVTYAHEDGLPDEVIISLDPRKAPEIAQAIVDNAKEAIYAAVVAGSSDGSVSPPFGGYALQSAGEPELQSQAIDP